MTSIGCQPRSVKCRSMPCSRMRLSMDVRKSPSPTITKWTLSVFCRIRAAISTKSVGAFSGLKHATMPMTTFSSDAPHFDQRQNVFEGTYFAHKVRNPYARDRRDSVRPIDQQTFSSAYKAQFVTLTGEPFERHQRDFLSTAEFKMSDDVKDLRLHTTVSGWCTSKAQRTRLCRPALPPVKDTTAA